ncbi:MAG: hypothetical protein NTV05_14920 [Acidobacteria bacterium]|nr:hypothetical protein [Acidobacteriota bacterium]
MHRDLTRTPRESVFQWMVVLVAMGVRMPVVMLVRISVILFSVVDVRVFVVVRPAVVVASLDKRRRHLVGRLAINPGRTRTAASAFDAHD